jgi:hypothetical protein
MWLKRCYLQPSVQVASRMPGEVARSTDFAHYHDHCLPFTLLTHLQSSRLPTYDNPSEAPNLFPAASPVMTTPRPALSEKSIPSDTCRDNTCRLDRTAWDRNTCTLLHCTHDPVLNCRTNSPAEGVVTGDSQGREPWRKAAYGPAAL